MTAWRSLPSAARWVAVLWATMLVLQRFTVPGMPVAILLPVVWLWVAAGLWRGVLELDRHRLLWWLAAFGTAFALLPLQSRLVDLPVVSLMSIALVAAIWAPFVVRFVDRGVEVYQHALRAVVAVTMALAVLTIVFTLVQLAGVPYRDVVADLVPAQLRFSPQSFVITYPITYGSPIMRSNAWIGLEPSFVSAQLGMGLMAALLTRARAWTVAVLLLAMLCTVSGSGIVIAGVGVIVLLLQPRRGVFARYVAAVLVGLVAVLITPLGQILLSRVTESSDSRSSTSLRTILPYVQIWPTYVQDLAGVVLGRGPGSSQRFVDAAGINGLLVPTPIKVFYEYGLIAGLVLAAFLVLCCLEGPSRALAAGLFVSMWTLQAGLSNPATAFPLLMLVTLWAPRHDLPLESLRPQARRTIDSAPLAQPALPRRPRQPQSL